MLTFLFLVESFKTKKVTNEFYKVPQVENVGICSAVRYARRSRDERNRDMCMCVEARFQYQSLYARVL